MKLKIYAALCLAFFSIQAQNKQLLYNFTAIPQSLLLNPGADTNYTFYFGVPLLSGISAQFGSSGFAAYDLFANNSVSFNDKVEALLSKTNNKDVLFANTQVELLSGGFKIGSEQSPSYVSFGLYHEVDAFTYFPQDLAVLAYYGNQNYIGKQFKISDLNVKAETVTTLHFGIHKKIQKNLIVGARAKIYNSGLHMQSTKNTGYIVTNTSNELVYNQFIIANASLNSSGVSKILSDGYSGNVVEDLKSKLFLGKDFGFGVDIGTTYYPKDNIQITASITDLGFINHKKDTKNYTFKGTYENVGVAPVFNSGDPSVAFEEFQDAIKIDSSFAKYTSWRPTKFNASYQLSFGEDRGEGGCNCGASEEKKYKNAVGAQLFAMTTSKKPLTAITAYYRRNLFKNWDIKTTYTVDKFSSSNIGLGLSAGVGPINLYLLADNLLEYKDLSKANALSLQFGLNFILHEKK